MQPAPRPPVPTVSFVSLTLALVGAVGFPVAYLGVVFTLPRGHSADVMLNLVVVGAVVVAAAFVTSIVGIVVANRRGASIAPSVAALVLSVLAPVTGGASAFLGLLLAGGGAHGRPFRVGGLARTARPVRDGAWVAPDLAPAVDALAPAQRERLAARWLAAALAEHASVAAFARLTLDLLALGAPPALVAAAQRAALEEVDHARACFAIAGALGGRAVGPGALADAGAPRPATLASLATDALVDGCLAEGAAAALAAAAAARCADPAVRAALARIADEEAAHAALSADVVRWCRARGGDEVARSLDAARGAEVALPDDATDDPALLAWGFPAEGDAARALASAREQCP
jgi:hypothetical protein